MTEPARKRKTGGGDRRSSMLTFQRRMLAARRLVRGPATTRMLIDEARAVQGPEAYPTDASAAVRHDIAALKDMFGCQISHRRASGYCLEEAGDLALLDLPNQELEALGYLISMYMDIALPNAQLVLSLLQRIQTLLPDSRRKHLEGASIHPRLDTPRARRRAAQPIIERLKRVLGRSHISFEYVSSFAQSGEAVRHRVAPYDLLYRDGHTYLEGVCLDCGIRELVNTRVLYRVDRIVATSFRPLPTQMPPGETHRHPYRLQYRLAARVAGRQDIAIWFPGSQVEHHADGSATITAETHDLWQARQILLRYREHCRILEPPELVEMMRETFQLVQRLYEE